LKVLNGLLEIRAEAFKETGRWDNRHESMRIEFAAPQNTLWCLVTPV
jgi:hypothetical protein